MASDRSQLLSQLLSFSQDADDIDGDDSSSSSTEEENLGYDDLGYDDLGYDSEESDDSLSDDDDYLRKSNYYSHMVLRIYHSSLGESINEERKPKRRRAGKGVVYYTDEDGVMRVLPPTMSLWYNIYVQHPDLESRRFLHKFRRRFRVPYHEYLRIVESVVKDNKTCCALHNMLLEVDGLDDKWEEGVASEWETGGQHDLNDAGTVRALRRLNNPASARDYDQSAMGTGNDRDDISESDDEPAVAPGMERSANQEDGVYIVRKLPMELFRQRLITHFDIAFKKKEIKWPKRNKKVNHTHNT